MMHGLGLDGYDADSQHDAAVAFHIQVQADEQVIPVHQHRKGQLILVLHGALTCEVENAMWVVPPHFALWVPGLMPHSNRATPGGRVCFLFIEPHAAQMPAHCCTLKIQPLVRELILTLAERRGKALHSPETGRLISVLFDELPRQPQEHLQLPVSTHPKIRQMVDTMASEPGNGQTLTQWAGRFAMSERNLARLVVKETGMSFRRWRHQLQVILAMQLLIRGQTVQQAAHALGYDSTTAFITMFRKAVGQTPKAWISELNQQSGFADHQGDQSRGN
ncbi:AraC family transcriptional regulator [Yokenella regensburgei]|uniref:AraC family transcriptional regulator n=1 Tax=Yokenella regensburgei TaxID=158877 RepID=UPI0035B34F25